MKAIVYGLVGGVLGAAVWAGVAYFAGYEHGLIAWGIGGLVGFAVAAGNADGTHAPSQAGILAVVISAVSIMGGKYAGIELMVPDEAELVEAFAAGIEHPNYVMSTIAEDIMIEMMEAGEDVDYVEAGFDTEDPRDDYTEAVWADAEARWGAMSAEEQSAITLERTEEALAEVEANAAAYRALITGGGFFASFGPLDLIFFGLAMTTAWGLASGAHKTSEQVAAEYTEAMQLAMIKVMTADGDVDAEEIKVITAVYKEITALDLDEEVLRAKATLATSEGHDLQAALIDLAPHLNDEGKASVLHAAVRVAVADGEFEAEEQAVLAEISGALGLGEDVMRDVVTSVRQGATSA